jgi:hypothetical protein
MENEQEMVDKKEVLVTKTYLDPLFCKVCANYKIWLLADRQLLSGECSGCFDEKVFIVKNFKTK